MADLRDVPLFDLGVGTQRRDRGREKAAEAQHRAEVFHRAQDIAVEVAEASPGRTTHIDAVYRQLQREGWNIKLLGPAAGKVFVEGRVWAATGERIQSQRITNNARMVMVWRLR
jgi:hypothetical protein